MKLRVGDRIPDFEVFDVHGKSYTSNSLKGHNTVVSFFRDATCPFCNLRIYELTRSYPELRQKGLMMLTFFSSPQEQIIKYIAKSPRPFPMIADPDKLVYSRFGVRSSLVGLLLAMMTRMPRMMKAMMLGFFPHLHRDMTQMPADFLIGPRI